MTRQLTIFNFQTPLAIGVIDDDLLTVAVDFPFGTDVTALIALFTHTGEDAYIDAAPTPQQTSGVSVNDFTAPVTYRINDDDGDTEYVVTVTVASTPDGNQDPVEWVLVDTNLTSILSIIPAV